MAHAEIAEFYEAQGNARMAAGRFSDFCVFCVKKTVSHE